MSPTIYHSAPRILHTSPHLFLRHPCEAGTNISFLFLELQSYLSLSFCPVPEVTRRVRQQSQDSKAASVFSKSLFVSVLHCGLKKKRVKKLQSFSIKTICLPSSGLLCSRVNLDLLFKLKRRLFSLWEGGQEGFSGFGGMCLWSFKKASSQGWNLLASFVPSEQ